jgi:hypothetical protein
MLFLRKRLRWVGGGAVALALGASMLGGVHPASAVSPASLTATSCPTVGTPVGQPTTDTVKLPNRGGISFGTGGLDSTNNPLCAATVEWKIPSTGVQPDVEGTLYMHNSLGKHAEVLASYYDIHGNAIGGQPSQEVIAGSEDQEASIHLLRVIDPRIYRVDVSTQILSQGKWVTKATKTVYMGSANHAGISCTIDAPNLELGGSAGVSKNHPLDAASCGFAVGPTFTLAQFSGTHYYENGQGVAVRYQLSVFDVHGTPLGIPFTFPPNPAKKNGVVSFSISGGTGSNDLIFSAQLVMQVQVGSDWQQVGKTVTWEI